MMYWGICYKEVWVLTCWFKLSLLLKFLLQMWQVKGFSHICKDLTCLLRCSCLLNLRSQNSQPNCLVASGIKEGFLPRVFCELPAFFLVTRLWDEKEDDIEGDGAEGEEGEEEPDMTDSRSFFESSHGSKIGSDTSNSSLDLNGFVEILLAIWVDASLLLLPSNFKGFMMAWSSSSLSSLKEASKAEFISTSFSCSRGWVLMRVLFLLLKNLFLNIFCEGETSFEVSSGPKLLLLVLLLLFVPNMFSLK